MPKTKLPFAYSIRRSAKVTRLRLVVTDGKVEVVAPLKAPERLLHQFVNDRQQWVLAAQRKIAAKHQQSTFPHPVVLTPGALIPYQGEAYPLNITSSALKRPRLDFSHGAFVAELPATLMGEPHVVLAPVLVKWLKNQARQAATEWLAKHSGQHELVPRSLTIKTQTSRWGSCGIHNDISLNWLLILAPPEVLEYVVVHELCHIKIRNHSAQFWALVADHLPDYPTHRHWLKQHGAGLMKYGLALAGK